MKITIDHFVRIKISEISVDVLSQLKDRFEYDNPKYLENNKYGYSNYGVDKYLYSFKEDSNSGVISFSRGCLKYILRQLATRGIKYTLVDKTLVCKEVTFDYSDTKVRPEQQEFIDALIKSKQGLGIAYTSFGKTYSCLGAMKQLKQPTLVCVHTEFLQKQWIQEAHKLFGIPMEDIGGVGGVFSDNPSVRKFNVCLYHSLSKPSYLKLFRNKIGLLIQDEVQKAAIEAVQDCVNYFPARYRWGVSANHKRKDKKEFLVEDAFGEIVFKAEEKNSDSKILSSLYLVPTNYYDFEYEQNKNYSGLITRMSQDKERNVLILRRCLRKLEQGRQVMILVERKEQACLLTHALRKRGIKTALLIGKVDKKQIKGFQSNSAKKIAVEYDDKKSYDFVKKHAEKKEIDVVIGTQKAEVGLSVRTLNHIITTTPMGSNIGDRLNQIIGRVERTHGKDLEKKFGKKDRPTVDILVDDRFKSFGRHKKAIKDAYGDRCFIVKRK